MEALLDMATDISLIARRLRELREEAGHTQKSLADAAGVSLSVVFQIEQGRRLDPHISTLAALANALDVSVAAFVEPPPGWQPRRKRREE